MNFIYFAHIRHKEEGNHIMTRWRGLSGYPPKMMKSFMNSLVLMELCNPIDYLATIDKEVHVVTVDIKIWFCFSLTWLTFSGILLGGPATFTGLAERLRTWLSVIFCTIFYLTARGNWERAIKHHLFVSGCEDMAPVQWLDNFGHLSKTVIALPKAVLV